MKTLSWGTGILITIAIFLLGIAALILIAMQEDVSLVEDHYYDRGQQYDIRRRAMERAQQLREQLRVQVNDGYAIVSYPRAAPPASITGTITFYRPSSRSLDRAVAVAADTAWTQVIPISGLDAGLWKLQIEWIMNGEEYYAQHVLHLQAQGRRGGAEQ